MKQILLRADDLGYSEGINFGIAKLVENYKIRTIGLIVNLTNSNHGYELVRGKNICLGLHTNISNGKPILDTKEIPSLVTGNGTFKPSKEYNHSTHNFVNYNDVYNEVEAQYQFFKKLTGKKPDYIDAHAVFNSTYFKAIEAVALKYDLFYVPSLVNTEEKYSIGNTDLYFWMESMCKDYDPCITLKKICQRNRDACEVMVLHPGYIDDELLGTSSLVFPRVKEVEFLMKLNLDEVAKNEQVDFITYNDLKKEGKA